MFVSRILRPAAAAMVMVIAVASAAPAHAQFTVLTEEQAHDAFRHMQHMQKTGEIEFRFVLDGCYARAHLMTERLRQLKIEPMKIWAVAKDKQAPLTVQSRYLPINGGWVTWTYHVAPAVHVKLRSGQVRQWVFDPSVHWNSPLDADQWLAAMRPRNVRRTYTASSQYSVNGGTPGAGAVRHARYVMRAYRERYARRDFRPLTPAEMASVAELRSTAEEFQAMFAALKQPHVIEIANAKRQSLHFAWQPRDESALRRVARRVNTAT